MADNGPKLHVKETRDREALRALLLRAPGTNGYLLGDLDPPFFERCRWFAAVRDEHLLATVLLYEGLAEPCLLSAGAPDGVAEIFRQTSRDLPREGWAKVPGNHRASWEQTLVLSQVEHQWMMALDPALFVPRDSAAVVRELTIGDIDPIEALFAFYPGSFFEPSQVRDGRYVGAFVDGELVSIAGTHVLSSVGGTALVGNIVTHAGHRGHGLASACTSRLIQLLQGDGIEHIALQVDGANAPAISCYRRLGFRFTNDVLQARYRGRLPGV